MTVMRMKLNEIDIDYNKFMNACAFRILKLFTGHIFSKSLFKMKKKRTESNEISNGANDKYMNFRLKRQSVFNIKYKRIDRLANVFHSIESSNEKYKYDLVAVPNGVRSNFILINMHINLSLKIIVVQQVKKI